MTRTNDTAIALAATISFLAGTLALLTAQAHDVPTILSATYGALVFAVGLGVIGGILFPWVGRAENQVSATVVTSLVSTAVLVVPSLLVVAMG